jgi:S-adenosylmethionine hydrolase
VSIITLTTDFGTGSPYVAAMKGVILAINPAVTLVDLTHDVRPQDVRQGALILEDVANCFPPDTIHVTVVDPGVGTDRAVVCVRLGQQRHVAPDNGLLSRLARRHPPSELIRLTEPAYWRHPVSATFHGRDIMAPAAAWLSLGVEPARLGSPMERLVDLDWPEARLGSGRIEGQVLAVDSFGNLITNITADLLAEVPHHQETQITIGDRQIAGISHTYGNRPAGSLIALIGSSGRLEVAIVGGSAAATLRLGVGAPARVRWI